MDVISSRFQRALTQRLTEARAAKVESIGTGAMQTFDTYKFHAGIVQGFNEVVAMIEEIEQQLNAETKG